MTREKLITYVGRLHPEKGVHLLLESFVSLAKRHPDWHLQIIGPSDLSAGGGGPGYLQRLVSLAKNAPMQVVFRGPIFDPVQIAQELRRSEIFVYPSLAEAGEALGLAPIEAAGQGAVPILSDLACFSDFAQDGISALIFDHRGEGAGARLELALERAITDPELRRRMRESAVAVAKNYEAEKVAVRHLDDYRRLMAGEKLDF